MRFKFNFFICILPLILLSLGCLQASTNPNSTITDGSSLSNNPPPFDCNSTLNATSIDLVSRASNYWYKALIDEDYQSPASIGAINFDHICTDFFDVGWGIGVNGVAYGGPSCHLGNTVGENQNYYYCSCAIAKEFKDVDPDGNILSHYIMVVNVNEVLRPVFVNGHFTSIDLMNFSCSSYQINK